MSKRSNLPGLRSGFAAGGKNTIAALKKLRAYSGSPCPTPLQVVAEAAWRDETHVISNRALYREKLDLADNIFKKHCGYQSPEAGFFLWLAVRDGETAAIDLWRKFGVKVLPGSYLSNENYETFSGENPGKKYIRVALVRPIHEIKIGLKSISKHLTHDI